LKKLYFHLFLIKMNLALKIFTTFVLLSASFARRIRNLGWQPRVKLGECQGDCDRDSDCIGNLRCFQRTGYGAVPGCNGYAMRGYDYCVRPQVSGPLKLHKCYRFESLNFKGQHMRHRNHQLWKDPGRGELYWKDSTFKVVPALNLNQRQVSFIQHIWHRNYQLWKDAGGELFWKDSTFKVVPALNGK